MPKLLKSTLVISLLSLPLWAGPVPAGAADPAAGAASASSSEEASPDVQALARKVEIVTQTKVMTAVPENEPQPIDLSLVKVPGATPDLTQGVTANAYSRYVKVEGEMVGQLVLSGVQKDGKAEPLNTENFVAQFELDRPELDAASVITVEGNQEELIAALKRLAEQDGQEEKRETAEAATGASGAPSNAAQNKEAAGYQNPEGLEFEEPEIPVVNVTTDGCGIRVDLQQMVAIQQSRVETTEGAKVTRSACEDGNERFALQRSYSVCGDKVEIEARQAQAQYLLYYTDAGGNRQEVNECTPDEEQIFPIVEKRSACTVYLDYAKEEAVPQAALVYQNASNSEVQVRGCEASEEVAAVPLVKTQDGCTIRHDFAANRSYRQSRHTYELEGVLWQAGACSDDGEEYAHAQVYENTAGEPLCEPVINQGSGTVTLQSRVQIEMDGAEQFISECKPDTSGSALIATTEGCTNPSTWTHDVSAGVSYARERFYYLWKGTRSYVSDCQESAETYPHKVETAGWQNNDAQLAAYRLSTVYIEGTAEGRYTIRTAEILPGAEEEPYIYEGETTAVNGEVWYEGCTEFEGQDRVKLYTRPDGTEHQVKAGEAAPLNRGNKCTVSSENRTVYAYTSWSTGGSTRYVGSGTASLCQSMKYYCDWEISKTVLSAAGNRSTVNSSHTRCVATDDGVIGTPTAQMSHYDRLQTRSVTHFPEGGVQYGAWTNSGSPFLRTSIQCGSGGSA
ncbi:hypothetical protein ACSHT0_17410 [Tepidicaulis sp. LMO-SS28]|uniref:hypothetical protein n=1 Tax=Tepidicaulis sp. LMO-SS28 TaxID=3447455 RepID=UPI003EE32356